MNKRIEYLDIAKGILIITVILSHSPFEYAQYMYWFHMPAFFIISGLLYRDGINFKTQFLKFYIPYICFSAIDIVFDFLISPDMISISNFVQSFNNHMYSGKAAWGVFWFIPVLLISKFIFSKLKTHFKTPYVVAIIAIGYIAAHIYSMKVIPNQITDITDKYWYPLDIDVVPIALAYYAIGFYSKNILKYLVTKSSMIISGIMCFILFNINSTQNIYYYMNIKDSYFKSIQWDLIYPLCFTIFILAFSNNLYNGRLKRFLNYCGKNSLIIMYLHRPVGNLLLDKFPSLGWVSFTVAGLGFALLFTYVIDKYSITKTLFKGVLPEGGLHLSLSNSHS